MRINFIALTATTSIAVFGAVLSAPAKLSPTSVGGVAAASDRFACHVTRVHDGDGPIWCAEGPKIRLTAIAAREIGDSCRPGHPCPAASGEAARAALSRLASGQALSCEATGTSYGRVTAWCWRPDGTELNCAMVEGGYAAHWQKYDPANRLCARNS